MSSNPFSINKIHTILYVKDQIKSTEFYETVLCQKADLNVPGMTEFQISESFVLGLMPNTGIAKILSDKTPHPEKGTGIPRCELYFYVNDLDKAFENALNCGAITISPVEKRNWGDLACYFSDPDGHIIAFAKKDE